MIEFVDISQIKPATYNPRRIEEDRIKELADSIRSIGFVLPVIVNSENNVIIAGHQRTKTAQRIGLEKIPVCYVKGITIADEVRFNQIHNSIDRTSDVSMLYHGAQLGTGFCEISAKDFDSIKLNAGSLKEICAILYKFGNCLSAVLCDNEVLYGKEYIKACQILNMKAQVYVLEPEKKEIAKESLAKEYGKFYYDFLKKNTYVQGLAQMYRTTRDNKQTRTQHSSVLYEEVVMPFLQDRRNPRILDFGCGKGTYADYLKDKGFDITGLEFYNYKNSRIDIGKTKAQFHAMLDKLKDGRFDVVVCDSVLNSTDCLEAESAIMACLNLFTSDKLFISGRSLDTAINRQVRTRVCDNRLYYYFMDDNHYTAIYRRGNWYYQKFHSKEDIESLLASAGFRIDEIRYGDWTPSWQVQATKIRELTREEYEKAIDYEFSLPLPNNKRYELKNEMKNTMEELI